MEQHVAPSQTFRHVSSFRHILRAEIRVSFGTIFFIIVIMAHANIASNFHLQLFKLCESGLSQILFPLRSIHHGTRCEE